MSPPFIEAVLIGLGERSMTALDLSQRIEIPLEATYEALVHLEGREAVRVVCDFAVSDARNREPVRRWETMRRAHSVDLPRARAFAPGAA